MSFGTMTAETAAKLKEAQQNLDMVQGKDLDSGLRHLPHTLAGFQAAFYLEHKRQPSAQEIFDAGVRSGLERERMLLAAALA
jgi:hypothetical protein